MKLLIVDDAMDVRMILSAWAKKKGYEFSVAEDGEEAWQLMMEEDFHIVISDWQMPKLSGPELCERIRGHDFPHYTYLLLLTGMSETKDMIAGLNAGADDYCNKPLNFEELDVRMGTAHRVINLEAKLATKNEHLQETYDVLEHMHQDIATDLENAARLQRALLPEHKMGTKLDYAWFYRPAIQVGGDTLQTVMLRDNLAVFYLVDVSGHGISAAMMTISLHTLIDLVAQENLDLTAENIPEKVVTTINQKISALGLNHYCTMIYGAIDLEKNRISYVQAGHPNPVLMKSSESKALELDGSGFPVGLIEDAEFETHSFEYETGDSLLIYSDGFSDLMTDEFPEKSIAEVCAPCFRDVAQESIDDITTTLLIDGVMAKQEDDISMMMLNL